MEQPIIMNKISSRSTAFVKKVLPVILLCIFSLILLVSIYMKMDGAEIHLLFFVGLLVIGFFIYGIWRANIMDLADEVFDCGEYLLIRKNGEEIRLNLKEISRVYYSYKTRTPNVLLMVSNSPNSRYEKHFQFNVAGAWRYLHQPDPEIKKLEKRIKDARM